MSDWLGLGIFLAVGVLALVASSLLGRPRRRLSVEEFEERARTGAYTRAGMFGLQQLLHPKAVKAIEVQQDLRHGYYNKKRVPGDGDDEEADDDGADGAETDAEAARDIDAGDAGDADDAVASSMISGVTTDRGSTVSITDGTDGTDGTDSTDEDANEKGSD